MSLSDAYDRCKEKIHTKYAAEASFFVAAGTIVSAKLAGEISTWRQAIFYLFVAAGGGAIGFRQRVATNKINALLQTQAVQVATDRRIPDDHPDLPEESRPYIAAAAENSPPKPDEVSQRATGNVLIPPPDRPTQELKLP
jgi:hypothetical protein